ncbi:uncharacterized protein LOC135309988 [Plodia interpunctella]|uniref:uncharacterized protein LOC135309988 n=1 Tax=Plodia interpunctella TaxID=58824 RepID=UPI003101B18D
MYGGLEYPRYLSGNAYVMSAPAAIVLYNAALTTPFFHLEDIFITGLCAARSSPLLIPRGDSSFTFLTQDTRCMIVATAHRVPALRMKWITQEMIDETRRDYCEWMRLSQERNRLKAKETTIGRTNQSIYNNPNNNDRRSWQKGQTYEVLA